MKKIKKLLITTTTLFLGTSVFAYNPPAGGQNLLRISSPELLLGAKSSAGGPIFNVTPDSIVNNPALPAFNQRSSLELSGSMLFDSKDESDKSIGGAFGIGTTIANRWCVPTFLLQGVFVPYYDMNLGNSIDFTAGYSKDITDNVSVGLNLNVGLLWGYGSDWTASASLGAYYDYGDISFLKDVRFGAVLSNLGKMFTDTEVFGIDSETIEDYATSWPGLATLRMGTAATLVDKNNFQLGMSFDIATPTFQNVVFDAGLQMKIAEVIKVSTGWEFDVREFSNDAKNILPSIGVSFNFIFKSKSETLSKNGWDQSEVTTSLAWQKMYENVDAVSISAIVDLGLQDTQAPEIELW